MGDRRTQLVQVSLVFTARTAFLAPAGLPAFRGRRAHSEHRCALCYMCRAAAPVADAVLHAVRLWPHDGTTHGASRGKRSELRCAQGTLGKKAACHSGCVPEHKVCCGGCVNRGQTVVTTTTFSKKMCSDGVNPVTVAYVAGSCGRTSFPVSELVACACAETGGIVRV